MSTPGIRSTFIATSQIALNFVDSDAVAQRWDEPSALAEFSLRGLVGHLYRATGSVEAYLNRDEPSGPAISTASYYNQAVDVPDIQSDLHRAVRQRGEEAAAEGHAALVQGWAEMIDRLIERLAKEPPHRLVEVFKGLVLSLDDYLATRLVELVVHADDLAASIDVEPPELPEAAFQEAISCLVEVARLRHGDAGVIRALARRERDAVEALRVL